MKKLLFLLFVVAFPLNLFAQENPQPHRFWDKTNLILHGSNAFVQAIDASVTQHDLQAGGVEHNPLARPFVERGWGRQAAYSFGIGVGATLALSYFAHKKDWHKLERLIPLSVAASTTAIRVRYGIRF